jgi:hypothetical protein
MVRVITNVKDGKPVSTTIPRHIEWGYSWAGYKRCDWCYVRVAPLALKNSAGPRNRCLNCGSLWHSDLRPKAIIEIRIH